MISSESIKYSLNNLKQRRVRSIFTILSIFIGITTIFIFISYGLGLYDYANTFLSESSADKVMIMAKGSTGGLGDTFSFSDDELETVRKTSGVYDATGAYARAAQIESQNKIKYVMIMGSDPEKPLLEELSNLKIYRGRMLTSGELDKVVLGYNYQIDTKIFPKGFELNDIVEIQGKKARIIGFYEEVGNLQDDSNIYVTEEFMKELYPEENLSYNYIVARVDVENLDKTVQNIEKELRKERGQEEGKEDFFVQSFEDLFETYASVLNIIIGFVIAIALISVVVSGVNTANTMITSVIERKKEIGIMKSIGSRNSNILGIFLFESSFLGFVAGVIGCVIGWALSSLGGLILKNLGYGFLQPSFPILLFVGCIAFATLTGAISGAAPAYRASRVNPVDALRYE
jgi:putative ABC transport system permease protein